MGTVGDVLDLSHIGAPFHIMKTATGTDGQALEMEWELQPRSSGTPVHIHPTASETYEVLEASFDVYVDGVWCTMGGLRPGHHASGSSSHDPQC